MKVSFVHFKNANDLGALERQLDNLWLGERKIWVNISKFEKREKVVTQPIVAMRHEVGKSNKASHVVVNGDNKLPHMPQANSWAWHPKFFDNESRPVSNVDVVFNVKEDDLWLKARGSFVGMHPSNRNLKRFDIAFAKIKCHSYSALVRKELKGWMVANWISMSNHDTEETYESYVEASNLEEGALFTDNLNINDLSLENNELHLNLSMILSGNRIGNSPKIDDKKDENLIDLNVMDFKGEELVDSTFANGALINGPLSVNDIRFGIDGRISPLEVIKDDGILGRGNFIKTPEDIMKEAFAIGAPNSEEVVLVKTNEVDNIVEVSKLLGLALDDPKVKKVLIDMECRDAKEKEGRKQLGL
ncbi:hypothetical protein RIF29_04183 [Crotalaria pallida]|uniref:Uncharacterized protein n=1 Tax=Crotalaria pallida TaxID=3830 RepID=A0AAN9J0R8_CROPI